METPEFTWITNHTDTRMIHDFGNGHKIVVNKEINMAYKVAPDQSIIGEFEVTGMLLETYEEKLVEFAESVQQPKKEVAPCLG